MKVILNARDYLKNRSLGKEEVKKFKIGYIEKNPSFFEKLKDEFSEQALVESGLFYFDEKKKVYVERFRGRLIFPINNISGQPLLWWKNNRKFRLLSKIYKFTRNKFF